MKKYTLTILLSLICGISTFAQVKIGYMSPAQVLAELDEVAVIEAKIDTLIQQRDQQLIAAATQLQEDIATYEEGKAMLNEQARAQREQEFIQRNQDLEQERENILNEIRQKRTQMMQPIMEKMDGAIQTIAQEMDLDMVLNEGTSYGDAIIFYTSDEKLNITQQIISRIKE